MIKLQPDFEFSNRNGSIIQLVNKGWNQVNVLESKKGSKRGGHYHKENKELFYIISGQANLILDNGAVEEIMHLKKGDMFLVSPYQMHTFEFLEDTFMVSLYDIGVEYEDGTKDIYSEWEEQPFLN